LRYTPLRGADAIPRDLENVFKERDAPARQDHDPKRLVPEFQVPIPSQIHEHIRDGQQKDSLHASLMIRPPTHSALKIWTTARASPKG